MKLFGRILLAITVIMLIVSLIPIGNLDSRASALGESAKGPDRYTRITIPYTIYEWWLLDWETNAIVCQLYIEHEGMPTSVEIYNGCGKDVHAKWIATEPCDGTSCSGIYLMNPSATPAQKEVTITLPFPDVQLSLTNCTQRADGGCTTRPQLVMTGTEPLPGEHITSIEGTVNDSPFSCPEAECIFALSETDPQGVELQFWGNSSYGDSTVVYKALLRVAQVTPEEGAATIWYVDVYSSQWTGTPPASCAEIWDSFPEPGAVPEWLTTPQTAGELASDIPFTYLAGNLISEGLVDVSSCTDGGLTENGAASPCGMTAARAAVTEWQNRFDALILSVAQQTGVPANLLKNMFSRESQFWPAGDGVGDKTDVGFGQLTEYGADTTLLWNVDFFNEYCPFVLSADTCQRGYALLKPEEQEMLRAALVNSVNASCPNCALKVDLAKADDSILVFAETLNGSCIQTSKIVQEVAGTKPGLAASYEDLWKFTLVNYNAGPGCLINALRSTSYAGQELTWENVSLQFPVGCPNAANYVNDVAH